MPRLGGSLGRIRAVLASLFPAALVALFAACHGSAGPGTIDSYWATSQDHQLSTTPPRMTIAVLRVVQAANGPAAFRGIAGAAVRSRDTLLAVIDYGACRIRLLHVKASDPSWSINSCLPDAHGDSRITRVRFWGDTLVAYDANADMLLWLSVDGRELRRRSLGVVSSSYPVVQDVVPVDDSTALVSLGAAGTLDPTQGLRPLLVWLNLTTGRVMRRALPDVPFSEANGANWVQSVRVCVDHSSSHGVAALSLWRFQVAFLNYDDSLPRRTVWRPLPWTGPKPAPSGLGSFPSASSANLICDDSTVLAFHPRYATVANVTDRVGGWFERLTFSGEDLGALSVGRDTGLVLNQTYPVAMAHGVLVLVGNPRDRAPLLVIAQVGG